MTFFTYAGDVLDDVEGEAHCYWRLCDMSHADITLSRGDSKLREELVRYGGLVHIQHKSAEDWAGLIRVPVKDDPASVTLRAVSAEALLQDRAAAERVVLEGTSGDIFEGLIRLANKSADTRLRPGGMDTSGSVIQFAVSFESLWTALKRLRQFTQAEWAILPKRDRGGRLYFEVSWYQERGVEQMLTLREGHNLRDVSGLVTQKREIYNRIIAVEQSTAEDAERRWAVAEDDESIGLYGLREAVIQVWAAQGARANVRAAAARELLRTRRPQRAYRLDAVEPSAGSVFPFLGIGDIVRLQIVKANFGLDTQVRIVAKEYNDRYGYMPLAVEEV